MSQAVTRIKQVLITYEGKITPLICQRWTFSLLVLILYGSRIVSTQGFHVITYCLSILILNLFLRFLTPIKSDLEEEELDNPVLPIYDKEEFKPFLRQLNEFSFWKQFTLASLLATLCTFCESLDFPVFWPVLVMYFIILFLVTMKRQLSHMLKHRYLPFDYGKKKYGFQEKVSN
jgi:hypothetical protein